MLYSMVMTTKPTRTRLNDAERLRALTLLARGDSRQSVVDDLAERYGVQLTLSAIDKMKVVHADSIAAMQQTMADAEAADADTLLNRSRRLIGRKLSRAERDEKTLDELFDDYRADRITWDELQKKKSGLLKVSIAELNAVSKEMYIQTGKGGDPSTPALPAGGGASTEAIMAAIRRGDTFELQRLIYRPGANDQSLPIQSQPA